jgi:hypothetical protein
MAKISKYLLLFVLLGTALNAAPTTDPWQDYYSQSDEKKHHPPPVPEPETYGAIFTGIAVALVGYRRWRNNRLTNR